jgi:hypothetical protein
MKRIFLLSLIFVLKLTAVSACCADEYPPITPDNVSRLQEVELVGQGSMNASAFAWMPDSVGFAIGGSRGIWLYESLDATPQFIQLNRSIRYSLFSTDGDLLFLSDGADLFAYELETQNIRYKVEGMHPLAISHDGRMLAYEVVTGVRVLEIATGEPLYELSYYGGILVPEPVGEEELTVDAQFDFAQFLPDDSAVLVYWNWTGSGYSSSGTDIWDLATLSRREREPERGRAYFDANPYYEDLYALDSEGEHFVLLQDSVQRADGEITLDGMATRNTAGYVTRFIQFSIAGDLLAIVYQDSNSQERGVGIWNIKTGEHIADLPYLNGIFLSPDEHKIFIGKRLYQISATEELARLQTDSYEVLQYTEDRILQYGADDMIRLLDALSLEEIAVLPLRSSDFLPNRAVIETNDYLLALHQNRKLAYSINPETGGVIATYETENPTLDFIRFSPDNRYFLSAVLQSREGQTLWDAFSGEIINLPEPDFVVSPYFYEPSGAVVVWDSQVNEIQFYDIASQTVTAIFPVATTNETGSPIRPYRLLISEDYLAARDDDSWGLWQVSNQMLIGDYPSFNYEGNFSFSEALFAYADEPFIRIIRCADGELVQTIKIEDFMWVTYLSFDSENSIRVDYENNDRMVSIPGVAFYSLETGEEIEPSDSMYSISFERGGLRYQVTDNLFQIFDDAGTPIMQTNLSVRISQIWLSDDATRLYLEYVDGTIGAWAVLST